MKHKKILSYIHWAWFVPLFALGITIWCELIFGHSAWQDPVVIISCLLIASYWLPLAMNWGGFADSKSKKDWDTIQHNKFLKKIRIIGIIITISLLMIAISRIMRLAFGYINR